MPAPPTIPLVKVVPEKKKATIYWDRELKLSSIQGKRFRRSEYTELRRIWSDWNQDINKAMVVLVNMTPAGAAGFNTGFNSVELDEPAVFEGRLYKYYYNMNYPICERLQWFIYSNSFRQRRRWQTNLGSLESSLLTNLKSVLPGTLLLKRLKLRAGCVPNLLW